MIASLESPGFMFTYRGTFDLLDPREEQVSIEDIAHALSMTCRFAGHVREFYSVAQHSVLVSKALDKRLQLPGLLHDAGEAYTGDLIVPMQKVIDPQEFKGVEKRVLSVILGYFKLHPTADDWAKIKEADQFVTAWEMRDLIDHSRKVVDHDARLPHSPLKATPHAVAKQTFLARFWRLIKEK